MGIWNQDEARSVDLGDLTFSAKFDYITLYTPAKAKLPKLDGKVVRPRRFNGQRLAIHDPSAADIVALIETFGPARVCELEVAVDLRPAPRVAAADAEQLLRSVMVDLFARGLEPSAGKDMPKKFRAFYRRLATGYMVRPFNWGLPRPTDQQLHGGRHDAVQVKAYLKTRDQGVALEPGKHVARVEVRLGSLGLYSHDLATLADLADFNFRKNLMPYFRHVSGTVRPVRPFSKSSALLKVLDAKSHEYDQQHFQRVGVGAFLTHGKRQGAEVRLLRNIPVNHRIGQALMRLGRQYATEKFVRREEPENLGNPMLARFSAGLAQSPMTNQ